jgi:hypothetical protein
MTDRPAVTSEQVRRCTRWAFFAVSLIIAIVTAPYRRTFKLYTWQPLRAIRATEGNGGELMALARDFKMDKYNELQSVQVAVRPTGASVREYLTPPGIVLRRRNTRHTSMVEEPER